MRINKKAQYGLLLVLYLSRSGRSDIDTVSQNLKLPKPYLEQIASTLRKAGILTSTRGRDGGFALTDDPTVLEVLSCLDNTAFLSSDESHSYQVGAPEHRALNQLGLNMGRALAPILRRRVSNLGKELAANEVAILDKMRHNEQRGH